VLVAIQTVFFGALRLRNTTDAQLDADLTLQRAVTLIQHDLAGIMLPGTLGGALQSSPTSSLSLDQNTQRVSPDFYTTSGSIDGWNPFSEVQMVSFALGASNDGSNTKTLYRLVTRNLLPAADTTADQQPLLTGLSDATFEFYDGSEWTDTWDSTVSNTLPAAIKVSFLFPAPPSGPAPDPIEIVVPIMATTSTSSSSSSTTSTP
jgi:type II secretion system protein J